MNQSGYTDIQPLGGSNDKGRDAIHISRKDPNEITIFAYSVRADWENKLLNEDCERIKEQGHTLHRIVFACTSSITSTQKDSVKKKVLDTFGWILDLFDLERLRVRLTGDLRHLIAQHPAIFCPPFFPRRGGLSIAECRDTLVIDHHLQDHALATWLARRLQLAGYRTWCYGTAPLAGESADESIRILVEQRAVRFLPIISDQSLSDVDFIARCGAAAGREDLVVPCYVAEGGASSLPSNVRKLTGARFDQGWSAGLADLFEALRGHGVGPTLTAEQGKAVALRSCFPEPVTKDVPETVYANTFATQVPEAIMVCPLERELSSEEKTKLRLEWAFVEADSLTLLTFQNPPQAVPLVPSQRLAGYAWKHYEYRHNKKSVDVVKELVRRSLDVACAAAGLQWCGDRRKFYFDAESKPQRFIPLTHVDGRRTRVGATGEKSYGSGDRAVPFRYQLCPTFRVGQDEESRWWMTMRLYVRITDTDGQPHQKKAIIRRRKKVTKGWWNQEWFARTLAVMQWLGKGGPEIAVGPVNCRVTVSTTPTSWDCPVAIDYQAVERIGDFQEELAELRYVEEDEEEDAESEEPTDG
jgi:hypothetical protein